MSTTKFCPFKIWQSFHVDLNIYSKFSPKLRRSGRKSRHGRPAGKLRANQTQSMAECCQSDKSNYPYYNWAISLGIYPTFMGW